MKFDRVGSLEDLWDGEKVGVKVGTKRLILIRIEDQVYAFEDRCPHQGVPLNDGQLNGCELTCKAHQWTFDVRTGRGINPQSASLRGFPVRIENGEIFVGAEGVDA